MYYLFLLKIKPEGSILVDLNKHSLQFLEFVEQFIDSSRKKGLMVFDGAFQDGTGAVAIIRCQSDVELKLFLSHIPFKEFVDIETIPLQDSIEAYREAKKVFRCE